jgi:alanyl-tRNA synthetase
LTEELAKEKGNAVSETGTQKPQYRTNKQANKQANKQTNKQTNNKQNDSFLAETNAIQIHQSKRCKTWYCSTLLEQCLHRAYQDLVVVTEYGGVLDI